jgi:hypothetical protein
MFARRNLLLVTVACCAAGCLNPRTTRLPTVAGADPRFEPRVQQQVEGRSLERHDPFPSESAGPQTFTRPRSYLDDRSNIRRTREEALLRGMDRNGVVAPPPSSKQEPYPDTVRE